MCLFFFFFFFFSSSSSSPSSSSSSSSSDARRKAIELQAQKEHERKLEAKRIALEEQRRREWEAIEERRLKAIEEEKRQTEDRRVKDERKREKGPYAAGGGPSNPTTSKAPGPKAAPKAAQKGPAPVATEKKKKKKPPTNLCHQWKSDGICTFTAGMNAGKARGAACLFNHDPEWRGGPDGPNGWNKNANNH